MRDGTRKATMKRQCRARASINLFEFSESTPKLESDQTLSKKSRKANLWMLLTNSTWSVAHFWASTSPHTTVWSKTLPRVFQRLTPDTPLTRLSSTFCLYTLLSLTEPVCLLCLSCGGAQVLFCSCNNYPGPCPRLCWNTSIQCMLAISEFSVPVKTKVVPPKVVSGDIPISLPPFYSLPFCSLSSCPFAFAYFALFAHPLTWLVSAGPNLHSDFKQIKIWISN